MSRPLVLLSVDFDFFVREDPGWKFDHGETAHYSSEVWPERERAFRAAGRDLRSEMSLRHAGPTPRSFWAELERLGYRFDQLRRIVVADSHGHAYETFTRDTLEGRRPEEVQFVNVDAHHDLFYSVTQLQRCASIGEATCENWHFFTLLRHRGMRSLIVYPKWRGLEEWNASFASLYVKPSETANSFTRYFREAVRPTVWGRPPVHRVAGSVGTLFIAKSSAWVPPWLDDSFTRFCRAASARYGVELSLPFINAEGHNPLERRGPAPSKKVA